MKFRKSIQKRSSKNNLIKFSEQEINEHLSSLSSNATFSNDLLGIILLKRPHQRTSIKTNEALKNQLSKIELETHEELEEIPHKKASHEKVFNRKKNKFDYSFLNTIVATSPVRFPSSTTKNKTIRLTHIPTVKRVSATNIPPPVQPVRRKSMFNRSQSTQATSATVVKPAKRFLNRYQLGKLLGEGTYGKVYQCKDEETDRVYALKEFSKDDPKIKTYINKEIAILKKLNHESIVRFQGSFEVGKVNYILMEHCGIYNLKVYVKEKVALSEQQARQVFVALARAVKYLHQKLIIHRDIKLENILIKEDGSVKLIDFGFSEQLQNQDQQLFTYCGTPTYMSPEIIRKTPYSGFKADCWALGMILYYMVTGNFPFVCRDEKSLFSAILRSPIPIDNKLSLDLRRLLRGMLISDCVLRYSIDDVLNHKWCRL